MSATRGALIEAVELSLNDGSLDSVPPSVEAIELATDIYPELRGRQFHRAAVAIDRFQQKLQTPDETRSLRIAKSRGIPKAVRRG